jgi:glycosyltransferase involved in cell wall biosynthesis
MDNLSIFGWVIVVVSWVIAIGWTWRVGVAIRGLAGMPDLLQRPVNRGVTRAGESPILSVVVPARNEEKAIEATLRSLLRVIGVSLEIVAVDDRSTDGTGRIMDRLLDEIKSGKTATAHSYKVIHIENLPAGWMGKTHAMATGARQTTASCLLFTDGDVIFREDSLARALTFVDRVAADHLVIFPTLILRSLGERMMMGFLQVFSVWFTRPWKTQNPNAPRDFLGIGAFNMIRRSTYESIGGFEALRMEVLEDLRLGYEVKKRKFSQHVVFGQNLVRIHWAEGAMGIVNNLTKNAFAIFRFRMALIVAAMMGVVALCLLPLFGLFFIQSAGLWALIPIVVMLLALTAMYAFYNRYTGTGAWYALSFPFAACLFLYALARSLTKTLRGGGVTWRGTFYPLEELSKQCGPLW